MDVSQFEQELASNEDQNAHQRELMEKLRNPRVCITARSSGGSRPLSTALRLTNFITQIKIDYKIRLALLYGLRYETTASAQVISLATGPLRSDTLRCHFQTLDELDKIPSQGARCLTRQP